MVAKIVRISIFMLLVSVTSTYAQSDEEIEKARDKYFQKQFDDYKNRVDTYVDLLNIDDFKGQIIKQKIDDYYQKRNQIMRSEVSEHEKKPLVDQLLLTHFSDVKELYTDETIASIQLFLEDNKAEIKKLQKIKKSKKKN